MSEPQTPPRPVVHLCGPWEIEYEDGKQRRVARCLHCDELLLDDRSPKQEATGYAPGTLIRVTGETRVVLTQPLNPEKEDSCVR